ncbi:MAG: hypothetical protein RO257_10245 [Candidatus Kapabacteria bacterium]|jgi:hypothetical protein|nr:hypothetical protein [Candidatus Kapabacteria bacterium]
MFEVKYITNEIGEKTDVVMSFSDYLDILEEIDDLRVIAERKSDILIEHSLVKTMINQND